MVQAWTMNNMRRICLYLLNSTAYSRRYIRTTIRGHADTIQFKFKSLRIEITISPKMFPVNFGSNVVVFRFKFLHRLHHSGLDLSYYTMHNHDN